MKRTSTIAAVALTAATLLTGTAHAAGPRGCEGSGYGAHGPAAHHGGHKAYAALDRMEAKLDRLDLSDEQRAKVRTLIDAARPQFREITDGLRANRTEMRGISRSDGYDEAAVRRVADRQGDLMAEMIVLRTRVKKQVAAVLTEAQRQELRRSGGRHHGADGDAPRQPGA